jgi:hypothetical protein
MSPPESYCPTFRYLPAIRISGLSPQQTLGTKDVSDAAAMERGDKFRLVPRTRMRAPSRCSESAIQLFLQHRGPIHDYIDGKGRLLRQRRN